MNNLKRQISEICADSSDTWITVADIATATGAPIGRCLAAMREHEALEDDGDGTWRIDASALKSEEDPREEEESKEEKEFNAGALTVSTANGSVTMPWEDLAQRVEALEEVVFSPKYRREPMLTRPKRYSMTQMLDQGILELGDEVKVVGSKAHATIASGLFVTTPRGQRVRTLQWVKKHCKECNTRMHGYLLHLRTGKTIEELRASALTAEREEK
ncbi:MAG: hypothetical protein GY822_27405 [Deltaproteobacteria bacterium]|nr:hypothetical protein [Deltaproteobacteria bacterium]